MPLPYNKIRFGYGKNYLYLSSSTVTKSGVTFTINNNLGTVLIDGVSTGAISYLLASSSDMTVPEGDYHLSGFMKSGAGANSYGVHLHLGNDPDGIYDYYDYGSGTGTFHYDGVSSFVIFIEIAQNKTFSAYSFIPKLINEGILFDGANDGIVSVNSTEQVSILGNELSYDTMEATVNYVRLPGYPDIKQYKYGSPVAYYYGDSNYPVVYYLDKINRIATNQYTLSCISAIGLLDKKKHFGNVYNGTAFSVVLAEIVNGAFAYTVDPLIADIPIYGWLPYDTARNNLRQLLFAMNVHITRDSTNSIIFKPLTNTSTNVIANNNIYIDGEEEVSQVATKVTITEHTFFAPTSYDGLEEELFNNTTGYVLTNYLVKFSNAPIIPSTIVASDGLTIDPNQMNCNYCVVSGRGIVTGVPYYHNSFDIVRTGNTDADENEVSVSDVTLINPINSANIADRIMAFYSTRTVMTGNLKYSNEKVGYKYTFYNAFREFTTGFLAKIDKTFSTFVKASASFISGYTMTDYGNAYNNFTVLTGTGTFQITTSSRIKVVIIGGGSGGTSGLAGQSGSRGRGGSGGSGGSGGIGGKIYEVEIDNPQSSYTYSCGTQGNGGSRCEYIDIPNYGTNGTETTFGTYSSEFGSYIETGFYNVLNGVSYGASGLRGVDGGNGGDGGSLTEGDYYVTEVEHDRNAYDGETVTYNDYTYAKGMRGMYNQRMSERGTGGEGQLVYHCIYATAGGGGGSAVGATVSDMYANGKGGDGQIIKTEDKLDRTSTSLVYQLTYTCTGGKGGNGSNAQNADPVVPTHYGCGGNGGHGGGGGGGNGVGLSQIWSDTGVVENINISNNVEARSEELETYGTGGYGSAASDGTPGCVIVFY